ncbi:MAG: sigma-54 dependent transcriptional regulator [Thermodesulfobacteriota bacterium]|jgi:two-component system response regulator AtoC|nr:MAG: sigma-54 dependent transcriptional regulator [Thermodesulfobacteriota bacterium]
MDKGRVLVVDDEENMRHMLAQILKKGGYSVDAAHNGEEALKRIEESVFDVVLCDVRMPAMDGLEFLKAARSKKLDVPVIMMSAYSTVDLAVEAMKLGASDYISKPFKVDEVLVKLKRVDEQEKIRQENIHLKKEVQEELRFGNIIARSLNMKEIFDTIEKVAGYKTTVLIVGESGTGKELLARAVHYHSPRAEKPFVAINCGAIPENLLESELFGHHKGSFTDAVRTKRGLFEEAHEGTLFLDEIGELPILLQVKLLRALQEEEIRRVGENQPIKVDVRIVAATVHDLAQKAQEGSFRSDLFYRLNVLTLRIPPLRERQEDIPLLVNHFLQKFNRKLETRIEKIAPEAFRLLLNYNWPGNVRELENVVERAIILSNNNFITEEALPLELRNVSSAESASFSSNEFSLKKASRLLEIELIKKTLKKTNGNHTQAAKILEISLRALLYKLKKYKLNKL